MNYRHKYLLVEAEKCRVLSQISQAENLYVQAIELAHENKYIQDEALAYELAAKFYLARGHKLVASTYMKQASYCYLNWGAKQGKRKKIQTIEALDCKGIRAARTFSKYPSSMQARLAF